MKKISFFLFFVLLSNIGFCFNKTTVYVFTSERCPHCRDEKAFLEKIKHKHFDVNIIYLDIASSRDNQKIYHDVMRELNILRGGLPTTIIGSKYFVGYATDETTGKELEDAIIDAKRSRPDDVVDQIIKKNKALKV